jgi:hypothetical protein
LVGKECHIIVGSDDKEGQIVVTIVTGKGEIFECRYNDFNKNVNIEGVYPILYKELKLTVKDNKQFTKDLKTISKVSEFVSFEIEKGSDRLRVNYITELGIGDIDGKYGELFVQLSEPSNFSYRSDNRLSKVLSCLDGWNGEIKVKKRNGRFYTYISGAIGNVIAYFKPELLMFERLHLCNHLGQPMFIDDIRFHINEGKTNEQIAEMYNISNLEAIEILRNASDNKDLFHYLVFHLGVADAWEKQAKEAIREMEAKTGLTLKIENKDKVYKQFDAEKCNDMAYLFKHGYATKEMKRARKEIARSKKRLEELAEIEKEFAKSVEKAKRIYEVKRAVVSFGISWDNVTLYDHKNELCFNWLDCCEKVPSDLINELVCSNTFPEGIEVTNLDKGRE